MKKSLRILYYSFESAILKSRSNLLLIDFLFILLPILLVILLKRNFFSIIELL